MWVSVLSECPQSEVPLYMGNAKAEPLIPRPLSKQTGRYRQYDMTVTAAHIFCASCVQHIKQWNSLLPSYN